MPNNLPVRRVWDVIDKVSTNLTYWLTILIAASIFEWSSGAFKADPFQTYSFFLLQLPFQALVIYASTCMMSIGYHLVVLEDCDDASKELNMQIKLAKSELAKKNPFFKKEFNM